MRLRLPSSPTGVSFALLMCAASPLVSGSSSAAEAGPGTAAAVDSARRAYLSGRYAEAIEALEPLAKTGAVAVVVEGRSIEAGELLVRALMETGRLAEAADLAGKLRKARPREAALAALSGEVELVRGDIKAAEGLFTDALATDPDDRRSRIMLKRIYDLTGRSAESEKLVDYFWDFNNGALIGQADPDARDFMYVAEAVKGYDAEATKVAFRHFMRACKRDPDLHEAYIGAGRLALEVFDWARAEREFGKLLERNPRHPEAHLGLAEVYLAASKNTEAEGEARKALEVNPALAGARIVLASLHLVDDRMDDARREIDAALAASPSRPDVMAMDATWLFASGDQAGFEAVVRKVRRLYPTYAEVYTGPAAVLERRRRFPEALEQYRRAVELDPGGWEGQFGVGMTLVRMGEETAGYEALETAFERNPFNTFAYNTLVALDQDFQKGLMARRETEHFVIKVSRSQEAVIGEQADEALETIWEEETRRFGFLPRGPDETGRKILFEMFDKHEDFSSRTAGIPNLGALGATLGRIVTMPSPTFGTEQGRPFRWTEVARHEFAHVVTLQLTDYKIPRWFTEGISVHVEGDPQIAWDMLLAQAAGEDELAGLAGLNSLITRPKEPRDVALGYYQSTLVVDWLIEQFGFAAVIEACRLYRAGRPTEDVFRRVTGLASEKLDREIARYVEKYLQKIKAWAPPGPKESERLRKRLESRPGDAVARARLAEGLVAARQYAQAGEEARKAIADSRGKAPTRAYVVAGLVARVKDKDDAAAEKHFRDAVQADPADFFAQLYLGLALWSSGRKAEAAEALSLAQGINPRFRESVPAWGAPPLQKLLADLFLETGAEERALRSAILSATTEPADHEGARLAARILLGKRRYAEALKWAERAISVNPFDAASQMLFARSSEALADGPGRERHLVRAARGYRAATAIASTGADGFLGLARVLAALGRGEEARAALEQLRQFAPANAEAQDIWKRIKE